VGEFRIFWGIFCILKNDFIWQKISKKKPQNTKIWPPFSSQKMLKNKKMTTRYLPPKIFKNIEN
jgi:hypothetical protein